MILSFFEFSHIAFYSLVIMMICTEYHSRAHFQFYPKLQTDQSILSLNIPSVHDLMMKPFLEILLPWETWVQKFIG